MATSSLTRKPIWERSLYWRIVLGFGACITGVLAVSMFRVGSRSMQCFVERIVGLFNLIDDLIAYVFHYG